MCVVCMYTFSFILLTNMGADIYLYWYVFICVCLKGRQWFDICLCVHVSVCEPVSVCTVLCVCHMLWLIPHLFADALGEAETAV